MVDPFRNIDIVDDRVADVLRAKSDGERMAMVDEMWWFARDLIHANLRREHPDWTDDEVDLQTARRLSHGAV